MNKSNFFERLKKKLTKWVVHERLESFVNFNKKQYGFRKKNSSNYMCIPALCHNTPQYTQYIHIFTFLFSVQ